MDIKNIENIYECSPLQKGMLFHAIHQPDTSLYVEQIRLNFSGKLDSTSFKEAWERTIKRHDALRTTFHWKGTEKLLQVVYKNFKIAWTEEEWNETYEIAKQKINLYAEKVQTEGFDISTGPLMNFHLLHLKDGYEFIWTFHHLLMDGWSMPLVLKDMLTYYEGLINGEYKNLPAAPKFYEYISWINTQDIDSAKRFFKEKLEGYNEPSYLGERTNNQHRQLVQDQFKDCIIAPQAKKELEQQARNQEVTLFSIFQALWVLLINARTDQNDIVLGSVMSGRRPELKDAHSTVGPFINTLPIRIKLQSSDTLLSVIKSVQKEQVELSQFEFMPLYEVQKVSELDSDKPLFDSIIVFENYPLDPSMFSKENLGFSINRFQVEERSNFPLSLAVIPNDDSFLLRLHFDSSVISEVEIDEILHELSAFIKIFQNNLDHTLDSLDLLGERNKKEIKKTENTNIFLQEIGNNTLHQEFERKAKLYGENVAVQNGKESLTYKDLNRRSDHIAGYLQFLGLQKEQRVAVFMDKTPDLIVAILGILKAGGVYVPLDTHMSREKVTYILKDSATQILLTNRELSIDFYENIDTYNIHTISDNNIRNNIHIHNEQAAYIMYTSGSTGNPKGVFVSHKASLMHYKSFNEIFQLNHTDRVLQFGTVTFDPSLEQIFPTLFSGGSVFIKGDDLWDSKEFVEKINQHEITFANLPTPYWNEIVNHFTSVQELMNMPSLKVLAIGGDKLSAAHIKNWNSIHKGKTKLYNFYGPTEIVTTCTYYHVNEKVLDTSLVSIGGPFPGRNLYILDSMGRKVPNGRKGELVIGGPILATGYLEKPGMTADSFIPDPFSSILGARMYRTGDIVRSSLNGEIQFLGRYDDQYKIRGFRVEIGEIEQALLSLPEIRQAIVTVETISGSKALGASVTVNKEITPAKIKSELQKILSDYMIPKFIQVLDSFPLLPNGKIDRKALPNPNLFANKETPYIPPSNTTQERMAKVWGDVLQVEKVGISDNYFELGGDSILGLQIISRLQEVSIMLTTSELFEHQTIEKIDSHLIKDRKTEVQRVEEVTEYHADKFTFTPIQQWFFEKKFNNPHHWNQSLLLNSKESVNVSLLNMSIELLMKHHDVFKFSFVENDNGWIVKRVEKPRYSFEIVECGEESLLKNHIKNNAIYQAQSSLNIEDGPILRVLYFINSKSEYQLFITIHHLYVDGVSWRVLLEDLQRIYNHLLEDKPLNLPDNGTSYQGWGNFLHTYANENKILDEYPYWENIMKTETKIPKDRENPSSVNTEGAIGNKTIRFTRDETHTLLTQMNQTLNIKIQEVLIASLIITLKKWTKNKNIKIDLEGHGREELEKGFNLTRTVGWFTTLFPFSVQIEDDTTLLQTVTGIVKAMRAIPNNGIGYGILKYLRGMKMEESPSEVSFNYLGQINSSDREIFELTDESVEPIRDSRSQRSYLLDLEGVVTNGELTINWMYCSQLHNEDTIEQLMTEFSSILTRIMSLMNKFKGKKYVPANFSKANLNESEWNLVNDYSGNIKDIYPLSPVQEGMLFHTLMHPNSGIYMEQISFEINGSLSVDAFSKAWEHVIESNSILKANFLWEGFNNPVHIINQLRKAKLVFWDWSTKGSNPEKIKNDLELMSKTQRNSDFDLKNEPLLRLTLVKVANESYYFIWTYHHLLLDGWSLPMVLTQLSSAYSALLKGELIKISSTGSYGEFVSYQTARDYSMYKEFWQDYLKDLEDRTLLGNRRAKPITDNELNREIKRKLPLTLTNQLKNEAFKGKTTLNTIIQTGWAVFLSFICQKENVVFGSVFSGRSAAVTGIEEMVGMFINTLPIKINVLKEKTLEELLVEMHTLQLKINNIENTSMIKIKEWIGYKSKTPLFDTCLIFSNFPNMIAPEDNDSMLEGVRISKVEAVEQTNFPLTISIVPDNQLSIDINYRCSEFDEATIGLYLDILERIYLEMTASLNRPVGDLYRDLNRIVTKRSQEATKLKKELNKNQLNKRKRMPLLF